MSKLQKKHSALRREQSAPDPDSESRSEYGSTDLIEFGSNPDPDPKKSVKLAIKDQFPFRHKYKNDLCVCDLV
jgi:hypothetical protein